MLLLGDGIRESTSRIADHLDAHARLNFALGLVEMGIYRLRRPDEASYIGLPRVVIQTVETDKAVGRIEDGGLRLVPPAVPSGPQTTQRSRLSEQVFLVTVAVDEPVRQALGQFLAAAKDLGCYVEPGRNSLKLKSRIHGANFANITLASEIWNTGIGSTTLNLGRPEIGQVYLHHGQPCLPVATWRRVSARTGSSGP